MDLWTYLALNFKLFSKDVKLLPLIWSICCIPLLAFRVPFYNLQQGGFRTRTTTSIMSRLEHSTVAPDLFRPRLNSFTSQAASSRPATSHRDSTNAPRNPFETPTPSLHSRVALSTGSAPIGKVVCNTEF